MIIDTEANQPCLLLHRESLGVEINGEMTIIILNAFWFGNVLRTKSSFFQNRKACHETKGNMLWINFYLITSSL